MKCPYCDTEMEKGVIQSAREVFWSCKKRKLFFRASADKGDVLIAQLGWNGSFAESYLCRRCKKVIFDYSKL